jgi:hypothetical protein
VGVRGIYLSNFISWNARMQTEFIIENLGFETAQYRERTFNIYDKLEDIHANGLHDYLKFLKFGYGRATDDAATEIRHGRMSREEGIDMVMKYDHVRPSDMDLFLEHTGLSESQFLEIIEPMRDLDVWEKKPDGTWQLKDNIGNHKNDDGVDKVRLPLKNGDHSFKRTEEKQSAHSQNGVQRRYVTL